MSLIPTKANSKTAQFDSLGCFINKQKPQLHELIDSSALQEIVNFTEPFSKTCSSFFGFEVPLTSPAVDFLFCVHQPESFQINSNLKPNASDFFNRFNLILERWKKGELPLSNIWFEYDASEIRTSNYQPNFFIGVKPTLHPFSVIDVTQNIFETLDSSPPSKTYKELLKCIKYLPPKSWPSQIGRMLARDEKGFRVFIQDISNFEILHYLEQVNYTGDIHALKATLSWIDRFTGVVDLNLDIQESIGDKLGLEIYFKETSNALAFLTELYTKDFCNETNYAKIQRFLKENYHRESNDFHPFFSHYKLIFNGSMCVKAKAYIGLASSDQTPHISGTKPLITAL